MNYKKLSCVIFLLISNLSFAQDLDLDCPTTNEEKVYLSQDEIHLENKQVFAKVKGQWIPMNQLHCDTSGFYVQTSEAAVSFWECSRCGAVNYPWNFACTRCGNAK